MALTGTIVSVVSTAARMRQDMQQSPNGYNTDNGYVYTFDMVIQCADGQHKGEIGSKTEIYPIADGQQISVTAESGKYGVKFKKFNPDYKPQQGSHHLQNQPQGSPRPAGATKSPQRDDDKKVRGMCRHGLYCATVRAGVDPIVLNADNETLKAIEGLVEKSMNGVGNLPVQQPNEEYVPDHQELNDNIPF